LKTFSATREAFLKEVQFESRTEAEAVLPTFARVNELKKFRVQKGKPLPKSFMVSSITYANINIFIVPYTYLLGAHALLEKAAHAAVTACTNLPSFSGVLQLLL